MPRVLFGQTLSFPGSKNNPLPLKVAMSFHAISNKDYCRRSPFSWYINIQAELIHILIIPMPFFLTVLFLSLIRMTRVPFFSSRWHFSRHKITLASSCPFSSPLACLCSPPCSFGEYFWTQIARITCFIWRLPLLAFWSVEHSQDWWVRSSILSHFEQEVPLFTPQPFPYHHPCLFQLDKKISVVSK